MQTFAAFRPQITCCRSTHPNHPQRQGPRVRTTAQDLPVAHHSGEQLQGWAWAM